jgi:hypothetical protein
MPANDLRYVYLPFVDVRKSTATIEGIGEVPTRIVSGIMTDETVDLDGEIVDYDSAKKAAAEWFRDWANVREQHSSNAIGTGIAMITDDVKKEIRTTVEVVDPLAITKIDKGVLKGQSVGLKGARKIADAAAPKGRLVGFSQVEDSLVDRPSNPTAKFAVVKMAKDGSMEIGEALIAKLASADENKLAAIKGNAPGAMVESPLVGGLVSNIEDGLNQHRTAPASPQTGLQSTTAGDDLDTTPGSALRRKKKPTPEIGGTPSHNAATEKPKAAGPDQVGGTHGHLHTHNANTDQAYQHDHGHDHEEGLHDEGADGDHQHEHSGKAAKAGTAKGSIIPGESAPQQTGVGAAIDVTSPSGATAGACPDSSCSCGGCGPSCEGTCCEACTMGDDLDRRETMHFGANAEYLKFVEAEIWKRDFTSADRKRLAGEGKAMPDGSFPIANEEDLHNAIRAIGRASNPATAKKHIKARAAAMGMTDALPADWKSAEPTMTKKQITAEEALEMSYANAAPHIKAALAEGDAQRALALMQAAEIAAKKGSIITGQGGGSDDSDGVETVPVPASGKKKRTTPEQGGAGQGTAAPESEDVAPTKAAEPDSMKALLSEVSKAVSTALKPLADKVAELEKRGVPGPLIRPLGAPKDVQGEILKTQLGNMSLEQLEDFAENYPDGQIRMGFKQILADVKKGGAAEA